MSNGTEPSAKLGPANGTNCIGTYEFPRTATNAVFDALVAEEGFARVKTGGWVKTTSPTNLARPLVGHTLLTNIRFAVSNAVTKINSIRELIPSPTRPFDEFMPDGTSIIISRSGMEEATITKNPGVQKRKVFHYAGDPRELAMLRRYGKHAQ